MGPEISKELSSKTLPDLRPEWGTQALAEVYADETRTTDESSKFYLGHKGSKIIAGEGALVATDDQPMVSTNSKKRFEEFTDSTWVPGRFGGHYKYSTRRELVTNPWKLSKMLNPAEVVANKGSKVLADAANVTAEFGSYVQAGEDSQVVAREGSTVRAQDGSKITAQMGSRVLAEKGSVVNAYAGSRVVATDGSTIIAMPGAEIEAAKGSIVTLFEPKDNYIYDNVKLKAEKGSIINVTDPYLVLGDKVEADIHFSGNKSEAAEFRKRNPELDTSIQTPDYSTIADKILGAQAAQYNPEPRPPRVARPAPPVELPKLKLNSYYDTIVNGIPK